MSFEPVLANTDLNHNRNFERDGVSHFILHHYAHFSLFRLVKVENKFVMNGEEHPRL